MCQSCSPLGLLCTWQAALLLNHQAKPPHGPMFKAWANSAMAAYPDMEVTTCHAYAIHMPFHWQCSNAE